MPSPFAHSIAGLLIASEANRRLHPRAVPSYVAAVLLANIPDLDYLPGIIVGDPNRFHRLFGHSIAIAIAIGLFHFVTARRRPATFALVCIALVGSHLFLDWLSMDSVPPSGIQLLWPLSDSILQAPVAIFPQVEKGAGSNFVRGLFSMANVRTVIVEILLFTPLILYAKRPPTSVSLR